MALSKPNEYKEVSAKQNEETVYAEDINQIISNIEKIKGGQANEAPAATIKDLHERLLALESGSGIKPPTDTEETFEEEVYSFEKTYLNLQIEGESQEITSNIIEDISNLSLVRNADGSLNLKGSFEINYDGQAVIRTNKQIDLDKRKLQGMNYGSIPLIYKYENKYLYIVIIAAKIQSNIFNIGNIKIYDNNIICPPDFSYIKGAGYEVSEDFGIYLVDGVYRLKGSFQCTGQGTSLAMNFPVNLSMSEFFQDNQQYRYSSFSIGITTAEPFYTMVSISSITPNKKYTIDMECPKQPAI